MKERRKENKTYNLPSLNRRTTLSGSRSARRHGLPSSAVATTTVPGSGPGPAADLRAEDGVAVACHIAAVLKLCEFSKAQY